MTKKRRWSLVVAAIVASLTFGGLVAMSTPAGAALATNWGKIWKTKLQPKADKRYYKKTVANKKFAPKPKNIRGVWGLSAAPGTTEPGFTEIVYPEMSTVPITHYIQEGATPPAECPGTALAPVAMPGHLCIFEVRNNNMTVPVITPPDFSGISPNATKFGATLWSSSTGSNSYITGTYAVRPLGFSNGLSRPAARPAPRKANMP